MQTPTKPDANLSGEEFWVVQPAHVISSTAAARTVSLVFALLCLPIPFASAQPLSGSNESSVDGQRPKSTRIGVFELLESGSNAFLELFERQSADPTPEDPQWNSIESPRHTVMTFVEAMNHVALGHNDVLDRAIKTFGDADVDDPRRTALDLLYVFDRLPEIPSGTIPGPEVIEVEGIKRFELFPRGIEHAWVYRAARWESQWRHRPRDARGRHLDV
ncbi:MAG: hypothetical protein R3C05_18350 [Pirellulaceae bacterium]